MSATQRNHVAESVAESIAESIAESVNTSSWLGILLFLLDWTLKNFHLLFSVKIIVVTNQIAGQKKELNSKI